MLVMHPTAARHPRRPRVRLPAPRRHDEPDRPLPPGGSLPRAPHAPGVTALSASHLPQPTPELPAPSPSPWSAPGPRGTSVLERLCASAPELLPPGTPLTVHVVDPAPPGPGRVWRTDQSAELLMNTVASQVTLFTDDSVDCSGPIRPGPSLYEWADGARRRAARARTSYPTRAYYGRYLEWVFATVVREAPPDRARRDAPRPARYGSTTPPTAARPSPSTTARVLHRPVRRGPRAGASARRPPTRPSATSPRTPTGHGLRYVAARQPGRRRPLRRIPRRTGAAARPRPQLLRPHGPVDDGPRRPLRPRRGTAGPALPPLRPRAAAVRRFAARRPVPGTRRQREGRRTAATSRSS